MISCRWLVACLYLCTLVFTSSCAVAPRTSYRQDVYPVLERNCFACHLPPDGAGYRRTGLNLQSYETLMQGTLYGPVIIPGSSRHSILIMLVEGRADRSMRMPHNRAQPLTSGEIDILRQWVEEGAHNN